MRCDTDRWVRYDRTMTPKEFRDANPHMFNLLCVLWSELSRCSRKSARRNLIDNGQGDYAFVQEDGLWLFKDSHSGYEYVFLAKDDVWAGRLMKNSNA